MSAAESLGFAGGFTVLMAVYAGDHVGLFERAVRSVYDNTLHPDAFVLCVDGPVPAPLADSIRQLAREHGIEVQWLPQNVGLACALNAGLVVVRTEWVMRADADDFNLPDRFARQARAAHAGAADMIGGAILELEGDGKQLAVRRTPLTHEEIVRFARRRNPFNHMTVAFRAAPARRCGGYPKIHLKEDYGLWTLLLRDGARGLNVDNVLVHATAGRDMYRRRGGWRYARAEVVLQRHLVRCRLKSPLSAAMDGLLRAGVFLLPSAARGWVYGHLLRS